ncbi:MAG: PhzF family phenazine biosynthesis protein [Anaerolineales bacterium]
MKLPLYQVDAFTDEIFRGNPAAVCPLENWLPTETLQKIAMENSVAETAFFIPLQDGFHIRWFTPEIEMDLCGHATLASAHTLIKHLGYKNSEIKFQSNSGELRVTAKDELLTLDFPSRMPHPSEAPQIILDGIKVKPLEILKDRDYVFVYEDEETVRRISPNVSLLNQINIDPGGIIVTAPGKNVDFVSRFFTPQASIFEDPVTGSAHCSLIPLWAQKLGKDELTALQISARGGKLFCKNAGKRVLISGKAVTYLEGFITI